jgi:integrase
MPALRLFTPGDDRRGGDGRLSATSRLSELYWGHIEPVEQLDAQPRNLEALRGSLAYWIRFTADPPIGEIDAVEHGLRFVNGLRSLPGKRSPHMGANTVAKHVAAIQAMLDVLGPPDRERRGALGLLEQTPYLQRPRKTRRPPVDRYSLEEIALLLGNADAATCPPRLSITPGEYMRRLYLLLFNTGMRIQEAILVRWTHDVGEALELPARIVAKGRDGRRVALNQTARAILDSMRSVNKRGATFERIFPWPWKWPESKQNLYEQHDRIRAALPIHRRQFFAFHAIRKATATELVKINAIAGQKQMGHTTAKMTADSYATEEVQQQALNQMAQPVWRLDNQGRLF